LKEKGIPIESAWPYVAEFNHGTSPESWADEDAAKRKIVSYYRITTLKQVLKALAEVGPVMLSIGINHYWYAAENFVIDIKKPVGFPLGNHAICVCGYDLKEEKLRFINSWGNSWADCGSAWMTFDYFRKYKIDCWVPIMENN